MHPHMCKKHVHMEKLEKKNGNEDPSWEDEQLK